MTARHGLRSAIRAALIDGAVGDVDEHLARSLAVLPSLRAAARCVSPGDVARAQMAMVDLGRVHRRLADAGILCVVLKGGALLASGRVPLGARHLDDLDILVPAPHATRALQILEADGFVVREGVLHDGTAHRDRHSHQLPMMMAPGGTMVELHVETHVPDETFEDVNGDAESAALPTTMPMLAGVRVPAPWRLLRQLCAHVVLHHRAETRLWPRHLFDMQAMKAVPFNDGVDVGGVVRFSRAVFAGFVDPRAPQWSRAMARLLVAPDPRVERAVVAVALLARTGRMIRAGGLVAAAWPSAAHLRFTGDLPRGDDDVVRARVRRWRRLLPR